MAKSYSLTKSQTFSCKVFSNIIVSALIFINLVTMVFFMTVGSAASTTSTSFTSLIVTFPRHQPCPPAPCWSPCYHIWKFSRARHVCFSSSTQQGMPFTNFLLGEERGRGGTQSTTCSGHDRCAVESKSSFISRTLNMISPCWWSNKMYAGGKTISTYKNSCITTSSTGRRLGILQESDAIQSRPTLKMSQAKIAIVGGGICGVTAAQGIKSRLQTIAPNHKVEIVIYEGGSALLKSEGDDDKQESQTLYKRMVQPAWKAATARNANSLGELQISCFPFLSFFLYLSATTRRLIIENVFTFFDS